jgi:hypothetical protein
MLSTHTTRASALAVVALGLAACGGGAELLVIPLFEFGFSRTSEATQIDLFFGPDKPTASSGAFDFVNMNVGADPQIHFSGTYSSCTFSLTFKPNVPPVPLPAKIAESYNGRFIGNDSIEMRPTSGVGLPVLTLQRKGTGSRSMGC